MQSGTVERENKSMLQKIRSKPFVQTALEVKKRYAEDSANYLAASITYYGFLSVFPLLLLGVSVVGFILAEGTSQTIWISRLSEAVPGLGPLIGDSLQIAVRRRGAAGLVGLLGLLWTGTGAIQAAGHALAVIFRRPEVEGFVRQKLWAIANTVGLGLLALAGLLVAGGAGGWKADGPAGVALKIAAFALAVALDFTLFLVSYRVLTRGLGPAVSKLWRGALLGAAGWTGLKFFGAALAVRASANASAVYGTFASVVGVLLLLFLASRLHLYGAELNGVIIDREEGGRMKREKDAPAESPVIDDATHPAPESLTTTELVRSIASDSAALIQKQVELAKQELVESLTTRVKALSALAFAGILGLMALVFLGASVATALDRVMQPWASRLVVTGGFLVITAGAVAFGLTKMRSGSKPAEKTKETIKEDLEWAKAQVKRSER